MDTINILKKGSLILELKLERCDHLVKKYTRPYLDSQARSTIETSNQLLKQQIIEPPEANKICWACLESGDLKDMHTPYHYSDTIEVYADMLETCLAILVKKHERRSYICDTCIERLRECVKFKQQIIIAQKFFQGFSGDDRNNKSTQDITDTQNEEYVNLKNFQHIEPMSLLTPMAVEENGYLKSISNMHLGPEPKPHYEKSVEDKMSHKKSLKEAFQDEYELWVEGNCMQFGEGKHKQKEIIPLVPSSPNPQVLLQGSEMFFKTCTVFLDTNKQTFSGDVSETQADTESPRHHDNSILEKFLSQSSDLKVEKVEVTPCIPDIREEDDITSCNMDTTDTATSTRRDDNLSAAEEYRIDSLTEYLTDKGCYTTKDPNISQDVNVLDLIPFDGFCRCPFCTSEFTSIQDRRNHLKQEHPETADKFVCEECGRIISSKSHLKTHVKNVHLKDRRFVCNVCTRDFYRRDGFRNHLLKVHNFILGDKKSKKLKKNTVDKYSCSACGTVLDLDNLKHHMCQGIPQPEDESDIAILPDVDDVAIIQ